MPSYRQFLLTTTSSQLHTMWCMAPIYKWLWLFLCTWTCKYKWYKWWVWVFVCCARWTENGKHDEYLGSAYIFYGSGVYEQWVRYSWYYFSCSSSFFENLCYSQPKRTEHKKVWLAEHALNWNIISFFSRTEPKAQTMTSNMIIICVVYILCIT